jgi:hypothetical protein
MRVESLAGGVDYALEIANSERRVVGYTRERLCGIARALIGVDSNAILAALTAFARGLRRFKPRSNGTHAGGKIALGDQPAADHDMNQREQLTLWGRNVAIYRFH